MHNVFKRLKMKNHFNSLFVLLGMLCSTTAFAQEPVVEEDLFSLSLEELMSVPINSASKKDETLFDAPLSSYTITRADMDKAGSTSIMEALRLAPGVIVREQTNGVYDIHIRGFDNIQRHGEDFNKPSFTTLVMIDNRPVFNHNLGGTFWEALPVDLNDVERIEVVRGPSAPLFGPNAVTGVINIITKRANKPTSVFASAQVGSPGTTIGNVSFGKKINDQFNFTLSGNFQDRKRFDEKYYNAATRTFMNIQDIYPADYKKRYADTELALNKWGLNGFLNFKPTEKTSFDLSLGMQESETQKNFIGGSTPFTTNETQSMYANLAANIHNLAIRTSFTTGHDDLNLNTPPNEYDFSIVDIHAEYEIKIGQRFSVVPGISYQDAHYSDEDYKKEAVGSLLNGKDVSIQNTSGFLRTDFSPLKNLRVIAALRADKFSAPDDVYLAYEFATTYKINEANLIRAAVTRSNSGSFIGNTYLNFIAPVGPGMNFVRSGNEDLDLLRVDMVEFGFRSQITKNFQIDLDIFSQHAENFTALLQTSMLSQQFRSIPTTATQRGATLGINIVPNEKIQIKPFVTVQKTETRDLPSIYNDPSYDDPLNDDVTYADSEHKSTPSVYGGYFINYKASSRLNFNINGYYFASHRQYSADSPDDTSEVGDISSKMLVNLKANFNITEQFSVFLNGRNIFNNDSREYYGTDRTGALYTVGASFSLH